MRPRLAAICVSAILLSLLIGCGSSSEETGQGGGITPPAAPPGAPGAGGPPKLTKIGDFSEPVKEIARKFLPQS